MHIEPGVVDGAKMVLAYGTAAAALGYTAKLALSDLKTHALPSLALRSGLAMIGTFVFFEILPHFSAGVSEVHFILGTSLFLLLGPAAGAIGLILGLLIQSTVFAPTDLPMFFVNVSTLLFPLFALEAAARRIVPQTTAYVDLSYGQVLKMSAVYQGGIVAWVAFWAIYGQGFGAMGSVMSFAAAYTVVLALEPLADLAILAGAKAAKGRATGLFVPRLYRAA